MAGVNIVRVPYKSGSVAMNALLGGEVHMNFESASTAIPFDKSGKLRALAVTSAQPSARAPGLPTMAAAGLPGYESAASQSIFAPAKTPEAIINRMNQEIVRILNQPDVKQKFFDSGVDTVGNSPQQLAETIRSEVARWSKVIKEAGIKAD
jgi:tripartite-type tricarboxylate transporter receptor subunit TctC